MSTKKVVSRSKRATKSKPAPFHTPHPLDALREALERRSYLNGLHVRQAGEALGALLMNRDYSPETPGVPVGQFRANVEGEIPHGVYKAPTFTSGGLKYLAKTLTALAECRGDGELMARAARTLAREVST
jgi:hypothetical protein